MKTRKILALVMALVLVLGLTACSSDSKEQTAEPKQETTVQAPVAEVAPQPETTPAPVAEVKPVVPAAPILEEGPASVDFEDGLFAFTAITTPTLTSDGSSLSIGERNGSNALVVTNVFGKKESYVGFDLSSMLGDKIVDVDTIKFDVGVEGSETFAAISGQVITYTGEAAVDKTKLTDWSIYLPKMNPKTVTAKVKTPFTAGQNNYIFIAKTDDVLETQSMWLDNIKFLDKDGNLIAADTSVAVASTSALASVEETEFVYGMNCPLNLTYQEDWNTGVGIPAGFFENAKGAVNVTLKVDIFDPNDYANFFAADAAWGKPTPEFFADMTAEGNGIAFVQADGAIVMQDKSVSELSFTITKEAAEHYATNGGMFFPGHNIQVLSATVSDSNYKCVNNLVYQEDWNTGVGIPAAFFADAEGPVCVTLDVDIFDPNDYANFFPADAAWGKPTPDFFVTPDAEGNGIAFVQADGAIVMQDKSVSEVSFTITKEAADHYAANGGMFFPGHNIQIISSFVSKDIYTSVNNLVYQEDWNTGVGIPAAFFAGATSPVNVILDVIIADPNDYANFFAADAAWGKPTPEFFADITAEGNGIAFVQADGAIVMQDKSVTTLAFTITKEAADHYAENGGMFFPGHNIQILGATVSQKRGFQVNNLVYQEDWNTGVGIPAAFFEGADAAVNVTLNVDIFDPNDYANFFPADAAWGKPTPEFFVTPNAEGDGIAFVQADGAIVMQDKSVSQITFTITKEAADAYAANGGMFFPGHNIQVLSAIVSK